MTDERASLRSLFLSQPFPSMDLLLSYHHPHFIFGSLLLVFDALGIKASYTYYVSFRDIQAPAVSEASPAEDVTADELQTSRPFHRFKAHITGM